jgi:hypothetical protein
VENGIGLEFEWLRLKRHFTCFGRLMHRILFSGWKVPFEGSMILNFD